MQETLSNCIAVADAAVATFVTTGNTVSGHKFNFDASASDERVLGTANFVSMILAKFGFTASFELGEDVMHDQQADGTVVDKPVRIVNMQVALPTEKDPMQFAADLMSKLHFNF